MVRARHRAATTLVIIRRAPSRHGPSGAVTHSTVQTICMTCARSESGRDGTLSSSSRDLRHSRFRGAVTAPRSADCRGVRGLSGSVAPGPEDGRGHSVTTPVGAAEVRQAVEAGRMADLGDAEPGRRQQGLGERQTAELQIRLERGPGELPEALAEVVRRQVHLARRPPPGTAVHGNAARRRGPPSARPAAPSTRASSGTGAAPGVHRRASSMRMHRRTASSSRAHRDGRAPTRPTGAGSPARGRWRRKSSRRCARVRSARRSSSRPSTSGVHDDVEVAQRLAGPVGRSRGSRPASGGRCSRSATRSGAPLSRCTARPPVT